jgi:dolichol-phosphate mannosyltransferase
MNRGMFVSESQTKLGLVVPTLNEAGNLELLLSRIRGALDSIALQYEILIVDDGSTDGTRELAATLSRTDSRIKLLVRDHQKGLAGAVIHGWRFTDAEILGVIDADLQHPPELLPLLYEAVASGTDIAIASRYVHSKTVKGWNPLRQAISTISTWVTVPFQKDHLRIKDPMSGFFMLRRKCIEGLKLQPEGFKLLLEILVRGRIQSAVEVPFQFGQRHTGESKADLRVALHYFFLLGKLSRDFILKGEQ